jgi:hypothetical protein
MVVASVAVNVAVSVTDCDTGSEGKTTSFPLKAGTEEGFSPNPSNVPLAVAT